MDDADSSDAPKRTPGPWRAILISLAAACVFGVLLGSYIMRSAKIDPPVLVAPSEPAAPGEDTLAQAQRIGGAFIEALRAGDTAGAYAQMARPYREGASLEAFRAAWRTPLLASPRAIRLTRTTDRAVQIDGRLTRTATFTATGALVAAAGALDTTVTFLREGDEVHVLAISVAGLPVLH
jgi:hypothetical protein